jgi:hypothetical protein
LSIILIVIVKGTGMDGSRFDNLARQVADGSSRRSFLKGLGRAAIAAVGIGGPVGAIVFANDGDAASCREGGVSCTRDAQCCAGSCGEEDARGRRRCACADPEVACGHTCCQSGDRCLDGVCERATPTSTPTTTPTPTNTPTSTPTNTPTNTPTSTPVPACGEGGPCTVFVSGLAYNGYLGGLTSADGLCQGDARAAGLSGPYLAWLADSTGSPATRFYQSPEPYLLVDGTVVANNWADLTDGTIQNGISLTATGESFFGSNVWTNCTTAGEFAQSNWSCNDWQDGSSEYYGLFGVKTSTDSGWTSAASYQCNTAHHLYCFEQPQLS